MYSATGFRRPYEKYETSHGGSRNGKLKKGYLNNSNPDLFMSSNLDDDTQSVFENVDGIQADFLIMNLSRVEEILADLNEHLDG